MSKKCRAFRMCSNLNDHQLNREHLWLVWLSGLAQRVVGLIPVGAHAWVVVGPWLGACGRQLISVSLTHQCSSPSLSPFLPLSLKKIKLKKKKKQNYKNNQKTINKIAINTYLPIITLNVNARNALIKRLRAAE